MNYLELLRLAAPEAIIAVTALAVLTIGLVSSRRAGDAAGSGAEPGNAGDTHDSAPVPMTLCSLTAVIGLAFAAGAVLQLPPHAMLFHGMLVISPLNSLFKIICLTLALFTVLLARGERCAAEQRRISRDDFVRHDRTALARRERRTAHDFHRARADRSLALRHDCVRQGASAVSRGGVEIFPFRQPGERFHSFRAQLHLRPDGNNRARRDRPAPRRRAGRTAARGRHRHDADRLRLQNRRRAISPLGARCLSGRAGFDGRLYRLGIEGRVLRRAWEKSC